MSRRKIDALPPDVREWLEKTLVDRKHSGYRSLAKILKEKGYDLSHRAIWLADKRIQRAMENVRSSTEAAKIIAQASQDEADEYSAAVIRLVQSALFDAMIRVKEAKYADPAEQVKLLSQAAQAVAQLGRVSIAQKRWQDEVRARLDELEAEDGQKDKRLDTETLKRVREALYGS